jgi:hypothetical protein
LRSHDPQPGLPLATVAAQSNPMQYPYEFSTRPFWQCIEPEHMGWFDPPHIVVVVVDVEVVDVDVVLVSVVDVVVVDVVVVDVLVVDVELVDVDVVVVVT